MLLWMWGDPDRLTGLGMQAYPYHYFADPRQTRFSLNANGPFKLFGREHELTAGVTRSRLTDGWLNQDAAGAVAPVGNFDEWDGSYAEPEMTDFYVGSKGRTIETGAYLAARLQLTDCLKFIGGARLSNWKRDEYAGAWTADPYTQNEKNVLTPYAGLIATLSSQISAYASYTDSFKPQTSRDRNGHYLNPLTGKSYEAGLKSEWLGGKLVASAAAFRIDQQNFAVVDVGYFVPGTLDPAMRAAQGVLSKGYELEASGELAPNLDLSFGWTHFSARDADGADVAVDHARELLRFFGKYQLPGTLNRFTVGAGVNWEGDRPATATNPATGQLEKVGQPAYALVDLMGRYRLNEGLNVQLNVTNALDKKYRSGSYWWGAPYNYGEPRKLLLSVEYGF